MISFVCMSQPYAHSQVSYWGRLHVWGGGGSISGFAQHIILLIWTFSCHTNGNQFLSWASIAVPYLVTEAFSEQTGFNVTLVVGLSAVILQLCYQGNSVTVMVKLLTAYLIVKAPP